MSRTWNDFERKGEVIMVIAHNMSAANAERRLGIIGKDKSLAMEKLSTGYKINRAADNVAGLPISEKNARTDTWTDEGVCEYRGRHVTGSSCRWCTAGSS